MNGHLVTRHQFSITNWNIQIWLVVHDSVEYVSWDDISALNEEDKLVEFRMNREISSIYIEIIGAKSDNNIAKTASLGTNCQ